MINNEIKASVVMVVNSESRELTKMLLQDAIRLAEETGEDVVMVNDREQPPIVKIADYNKLLYEKQKKDKENKKKQRANAQNLKEIQISDSIADHDLKIKAKNADRILNEGNKVSLVIRYKGRSIRFISEGPEKLQKLVDLITVNNKVEKPAKIEGNRVSMVISPVK